MTATTPDPPTTDERLVLDAVRDCPARGEIVDRAVPGCACGPTRLCRQYFKIVADYDCRVCRSALLFPSPAPGPAAPVPERGEP